MRDITLGDTFRHQFTTRAFATGVPTQLAGSPVLSVLEENNATPITAGVTVSVDRASVTGLNEATIVATSGNGYAAGKSYAIYISTGTVGGTSVVGEVVGQFTIGASAAAVDLANATDGLSALNTLLGDINDRIPAVLSGGRIQAVVGAMDANVMTAAAAAADLTAELQSGLATAAALATAQTAIDIIDDFLDTEIAAIKAKTDLLPASPAGVGDAMTLTSAYEFAKGTVAMVEAYAANGVAPTPVQAIFALHQMLMAFAIASTSLTVKKLNGSTTAFIATLDSATAPTAIARS